MDGKARQQREEKNGGKREGGEEVDLEPAATAEKLNRVKLSVDSTFPLNVCEIYYWKNISDHVCLH